MSLFSSNTFTWISKVQGFKSRFKILEIGSFLIWLSLYLSLKQYRKCMIIQEKKKITNYYIGSIRTITTKYYIQKNSVNNQKFTPLNK